MRPPSRPLAVVCERVAPWLEARVHTKPTDV